VIMSSDGYIITCAHVVSGASTIKVTTSDNKTYDATLVAISLIFLAFYAVMLSVHISHWLITVLIAVS
jgi:hypothetical protein